VQSQQESVVQGWVAPARDGGGVRIGVVGCGYWGSKHVRVLRGVRNVSEVVLIDSNPRTRGAILSALPAARAFADLD
jgi:predicted dehydrogenase